MRNLIDTLSDDVREVILDLANSLAMYEGQVNEESVRAQAAGKDPERARRVKLAMRDRNVAKFMATEALGVATGGTLGAAEIENEIDDLALDAMIEHGYCL